VYNANHRFYAKRNGSWLQIDSRVGVGLVSIPPLLSGEKTTECDIDFEQYYDDILYEGEYRFEMVVTGESGDFLLSYEFMIE